MSEKLHVPSGSKSKLKQTSETVVWISKAGRFNNRKTQNFAHVSSAIRLSLFWIQPKILKHSHMTIFYWILDHTNNIRDGQKLQEKLLEQTAKN